MRRVRDREVVVAVRVPAALVRAVDRYGVAARSASRSDAIRALLLAGLGAEAAAGAEGSR